MVLVSRRPFVGENKLPTSDEVMLVVTSGSGFSSSELSSSMGGVGGTYGGRWASTNVVIVVIGVSVVDPLGLGGWVVLL